MDHPSPHPPPHHHQVAEVGNPSSPFSYIWEKPRDDDGMLESIVNQATNRNSSHSCVPMVDQYHNLDQHNEPTIANAPPLSEGYIHHQDAEATKEIDKKKKGKSTTTPRRGSTSYKKWSRTTIGKDEDDEIDKRIKTLQNLVPNSRFKTDEASILDEVIKYIKKLQNQVQMMIMMRSQMNMRYMMMMRSMNMMTTMPHQALLSSMMAQAVSHHPHHHSMPQEITMDMEGYNRSVALYHQLHHQYFHHHPAAAAAFSLAPVSAPYNQLYHVLESGTSDHPNSRQLRDSKRKSV